MLFLKNKNYPFGLDLSDRTLKLVKLCTTGSKIKVQALSRYRLKKGVIENGEIINQDILIKSIKELIDKPNFGSVNNKKVAACLPDSKTFIKTIFVEKNQNRLADNLEMEIEKNFPLFIKEIYFDYQIIKEDSSHYTVLVGAAMKKTVDQYVEVFKQAGLLVSALEIEPVSICRCLLPEESPKFDKKKGFNNYAIIDIGGNRTSLIVYAEKTIVMSVRMPISGRKTTEKIATSLELSEQQAEKAKIICGLDKEKAKGIVYNILSETINDLLDKIKEALDYYYNHYADFGVINNIYLCGGGSNIKNLTGIISKTVSIDTQEGDVFLNLNDDLKKYQPFFTEKHYLNKKTGQKAQEEEEAIDQNIGLSYATAIGLALRNIYQKNQ